MVQIYGIQITLIYSFYNRKILRVTHISILVLQSYSIIKYINIYVYLYIYEYIYKYENQIQSL